jgi:tight adherence protein B
MDMMLIGAALLVMLAVGGVGFAVAGGGPDVSKLKKRARAMNDAGGGGLKRKNVPDANAVRRAKVTENLKDMEQRERQRRSNLLQVKSQITQSGLAITEPMFWMASVAVAIVAGGLGFAIFMTKDYAPFVALGLAVAAGFGLPRWFLGFVISGRQKKFSGQFADSIDVIVRGVKSGLPLNECLRIIARESNEPVRTEFKNVCDGLALGVPLDQALQKMFDRMPLPEVNFFAIVLGIQAKAGGNLSEALSNLSTVLRARRLLREKIKALSSEAKASAWIIGAMPVIVIVLVYLTSPGYIIELFVRPMGNLILLASAMLMGMGVFVMKQMINFKY